MIEGEVTTRVLGSTFYHSFSLVVPALDGYTYRLFEISHNVSPYPVSVPEGDLEDEKVFLNWLQGKLSSDETRRIAGNLLAQARS